MSRAGYLLVGGESSRMGRDKALLPLAGRTLLESLADLIEVAAGTVTLVGHPERYVEFRYPATADIEGQLGPLGGVVSALRSSKAAWNVIVACDMPEVALDLLRTLFDAAEAADDHDAVVPVTPEGHWERSLSAGIR